MTNFSFIDLFAGIGGFRIALESMGGTCLGFSEIAPDAIRTYCDNFNESENANFGDITKLKTLPPHDFMTAGVPCQSWSIAGKNLGFDDDRGQLWNDTLFLLNKVKPKVFIFENVKGLSDPRNEDALNYILERISKAGYHARKLVLNAYDYGSPQTRVRIYIIGFREKGYLDRMILPQPSPGSVRLCDVLDGNNKTAKEERSEMKARWSLSCNNQGFNDYFLFNDIRNGDTTIHSWDITETSQREKEICYLLLKNRRKRDYGEFDGNPLSLKHFQGLDPTICKEELETLVKKNILKEVEYTYEIKDYTSCDLSEHAKLILATSIGGTIVISRTKNDKEIKKNKVNVSETIEALKREGIIMCTEIRYDFKNSKISTGLEGVNRIFLPSCKIYPTMVASDTNDFITTTEIEGKNIEEFRQSFINNIYLPGDFRKITKTEACRIQGFPPDYKLPPTRPRWMKLIGNSVAVPVIKMLAKAIIDTGVFACQTETIPKSKRLRVKQLNLTDLFEEFAETNITENLMAQENTSDSYGNTHTDQPVIEHKDLLVCLVKKDNEVQYLNRTAKVYYTGKRFPASIALRRMYYFMPYIKGKGIRDLYLIKTVRIGTRKEGQPQQDSQDLRLVFEIEFIKQLFDDYKPIPLDIWRTFTDSTLKEITQLFQSNEL